MMSTGLSLGQVAGRTSSSLAMVSADSSVRAAAVADERVGGQHAGAAGVGEDGQVVALGQRLLAQDLGEVEEVADAVGTQHAGAAEGRVEDLVGAGHASRCARPRPREASSVRPGFMTMMGFCSATSRTAQRKARASPTVSM